MVVSQLPLKPLIGLPKSIAMAGADKVRAHKVAVAHLRRDRFRPLEFETGVVVILLPNTSFNDVLFSYTPHIVPH
jgi:hypothetical protein